MVIKLLNSGGPGIGPYLRQLVGRLEPHAGPRCRFAVSAALAPRITIQFLTARHHARTIGGDSVGSTRTLLLPHPSPGMNPRAGPPSTGASRAAPDQVKATLIHELTHAIGCGGHFGSISDRRRSVLYESSQITTWSQNDAALIRLLYSPWTRAG